MNTVPNEKACLWLCVTCSTAPGFGVLMTSAVIVWGLSFSRSLSNRTTCSLLLSSCRRTSNAAAIEQKDLKCYTILHYLVLEAAWATDTFRFENQYNTTGKTPNS